MRKIMIIALLTATLVGCTAPNVPISPVVTSTSISQQTSIPTFTSQPNLTSRSTSDLEYVKECPRKDTGVNLKDVSSGTILQDGLLLDIQTGRKYLLSSKSTSIVAHDGSQISPNRNMFAYIEPVQNDQTKNLDSILWVVDAQAKILARILLDQINRSELHGDELIEPRWLDNENLLIYTNQTYKDLSVLLVNPFTGEQKLISNTFPMLVDSNNAPFMPWVVEYSPDLKWLVYLGGPGGATVRDVFTKDILWQSSKPSGGKPVWSPDGQQVAVMGDSQLYIINRSGQAKPILDEKSENQAYAPSWSPDGHKIAFWNFDNLMVYDLHDGKVVDLCTKNQAYTIIYPARWSPDSTQLMIREQTSAVESDGVLLPIIIDLRQNIIYRNLSGGQNARGEVWMNSLP